MTFTATFGQTCHWRALSTSGFFLWTILQKGSERCVLIDFDLQNYPSPVLWRWFSMYPRVHAREHDLNLCNGHRHDIASRRCCGEHRRSSRAITAGSRWRCFGLRSKMRVVIRFKTRRNRFIARRGETTELLLFFVVHLSDLRVRSHHSHSVS